MDIKRKRDKEREDTAIFKKKRAMKKIELRNSQDSSEIREGTTYETSVDENNNREGLEDITEIPPPLSKPRSTPIVNDDCTFVYFDLETTGLGKSCHVYTNIMHRADSFKIYGAVETKFLVITNL
jgi:uncharacterized protein YprB with RNaseH-like and TPR domain